MKNDAPAQVQCRLMINGKVIEFALDGPLVALRPDRKSAEKKSRKGGRA